jgi:thiol-disulfide isomerase/thioredoxin
MVRKYNGCATHAGPGGFSHRVLRLVSVRVLGVIMLALAFLAGGCASTRDFMALDNSAEVSRFVQGYKEPVLLVFAKTGCPPCILLEPTLDQLATEYKGRVAMGKFSYSLFSAHSAAELIDKYNIETVPTVILLVNGQEKKRWLVDYKIDDYRKVLDEYVASSAPAGGGAAGPPTVKPQ